MSEQKIHVINFSIIAREIYEHLKAFYIEEGTELSDTLVVDHLTELFINMAYYVIYETRDPLIRNSNNTIKSIYSKFEEKTGLNGAKTLEILSDNPLYVAMENQIIDIVSKNEWEEWYVCRGYMESMGDFRINQWKREHIVNGKYQSKPLIVE